MKENELILMKKKIEQLTNVVNGLIQKLQQVDSMAKGTLTTFQLHIGEDSWKELVNELQDLQFANEEESIYETGIDLVIGKER